MATGFQSERDAVEQRFDGQYGGTLEVAYDNVEYVPKIETPFVRVVVRPARSDQVSIGSNPKVRHRGEIICQVFTPAGDGARAADGHADEVAAVFDNATFSGIICRSAYRRFLGISTDGWHQINVHIPYQRDRTG